MAAWMTTARKPQNAPNTDMLKSILIGLDESPYCDAAVTVGINWAKRFDCLLVGLGVVDEPAIRGPKPPGHMTPSYRATYDSMVAEASHRVDRLLEHFTLRCSQEGVSNKLLEDVGSPCEQIMTEAQRYDVILVGQKTYSQSGAVEKETDMVDALLHATPRPVVVVPGDYQKGSGVLVAYDGSLQSARSLQAFVGSGLAALGKVSVVTAHKQSTVEAGRIADRAVEYLRFHDIEAQPHALTGGARPSDDILQVAEQQNAELIVMGSHGRSALTEFFMGSVTKNVLERSKIPLFVYH